MPLVFASMPFDAQFSDVFFVAIEGAAKDAGAVAVRVDRAVAEGSLPEEIRRQIRRSTLVVADVSGANPNVLHEVGYAEGCGKPVIQLSMTPLNRLPFNVRHRVTLLYRRGQTYELRSRLRQAIAGVLRDSSIAPASVGSMK